MIRKRVGVSLVVALVCCGFVHGQEQKAGIVVGIVKGLHKTKDGKNAMLEVLAPGEEKARSYHVMYDPKIKGPNPTVLAAVRSARVGDRVEINWLGTGHGPAIQSFKILKKATE